MSTTSLCVDTDTVQVASSGSEMPASSSLASRNKQPERAVSKTATSNSSSRGTKLISDSTRWWFMAVPGVVMCLYGIVFIFNRQPSDPEIQSRLLSSWSGIFHVLGGLVSVGIGPFQFHHGLRRHYPAVHRWAGRLYVAAIVAGGVGGFNVSMDAISYPIGDYGFAILALSWLGTIWKAMSAIWHGEVARHREWMMRNYALTYAAVMLRWQQPLLILFGMSDELSLTIVAYTSWVPSLFFVQWWLQSKPTPLLK